MDITRPSTSETDRRRHERRPFERPCKVLHAPTLRYLAAETMDLSSGGLLIELAQQRMLHVGDRLDVMVDWARHGIVESAKMLPATVAWIDTPSDHGQRVGVAFEDELTVSQAA